jgi:hypothetical protein
MDVADFLYIYALIQLGHSDVEKFLQAPDNILKTAYKGLSS